MRDVHKLCVIADSSDDSAAEIEERLNQWLGESGRTFNLKIVRINADDPETNWQSFGIPSAPPSLPVTVLVGRNSGFGESFVIDHWDPAPTADELSAIVDSPRRHLRYSQDLANHALSVRLDAWQPKRSLVTAVELATPNSRTFDG